MSDNPVSPTPETLKAAFKAFKKRLKLTRLDDESSLRGGHTTSGRNSGIVAITPPNDFPAEVWEELVRQGKIKRAGRGTYELVDQN
jgi:aryl-alcohol dehydrogenase-like predicted oxidoreductase